MLIWRNKIDLEVTYEGIVQSSCYDNSPWTRKTLSLPLFYLIIHYINQI